MCNKAPCCHSRDICRTAKLNATVGALAACAAQTAGGPTVADAQQMVL